MRSLRASIFRTTQYLRRAVRPLQSAPVRTAGLANTATSASSVNDQEVEFFSRLSSQWWDESGEFSLLHRMNPVRVQFIKDKLVETMRFEAGEDAMDVKSAKPLSGLDILDVGCGGGLLSESLVRLGARTLGIDASSSNIGIAATHASHDPEFNCSNASSPASLTYRNISAEALLDEPKRYDVVCSMEVIEHVDNPALFLQSCANLVKPGGHLFLSTISRTPFAYFLTIFAAETLLRMVRLGTHTYSKYVKPEELLDFFQKPIGSDNRPWISRLHNGSPIQTEAEVRGMLYLPWGGSWILASRGSPLSTQCNYLFWARKPHDM